MSLQLSFIGFGEAGRAFAPAMVSHTAKASAYDILADTPPYIESFKENGIDGYSNPAQALAEKNLVLCLVTADQQQIAAEQIAKAIFPDTLYCDMNSVAPDSKKNAARLIEGAGARYVDVAIMAPVHPARENVPLLISGPHSNEAEQMLKTAGFTNVRTVGDNIGQASSIKMIRSIMVKGIEALTAECVLAAEKAGVRDAVLESLGSDWPDKAVYNLERMQTHGLRRAAEMEEVAKTLEALGIDPVMTRGTILKQFEMARSEEGI